MEVAACAWYIDASASLLQNSAARAKVPLCSNYESSGRTRLGPEMGERIAKGSCRNLHETIEGSVQVQDQEDRS